MSSNDHFNFSRWLRRWLFVLALGGLLSVSLNADEQVPSNNFIVSIDASETTTEHSWEVHVWHGDGGEPPDATVLGPHSMGATSWSPWYTCTTGEVAEPGVYPNLLNARIYRDGIPVDIATFAYRRDESGDCWVTTSGAYTYVYTASEPASNGMTLAEFTTTKTESVAALQYMALETNRTPEEVEAEATSQGDTLKTSLEEIALPPVESVPSTSTTHSALAISVPRIGVLNFDPMAYGPIADVIPWIRSMITFLMLLTWFWWAWQEFQDVMQVVGNAQQAKGNPVVGGTGAQATAVIAAAAIAVLILAVPVAWWALVTISGDPLASNPLNESASIPASALYVVGLLLRYDLLITLVIAAFVMRKGRVVIVSTLQAVVRAIVP